MRKRFGLRSYAGLTAALVVLVAAASLTTLMFAGVASASGSLDWNGKNGLTACDVGTTGSMLWIFNPHSAAVPGDLTVDGTVYPASGWTNSGGGQNWHYTIPITSPSGFPPTSASLTYTGDLGSNPILTISGCNEGGIPPASDLSVSKSADGSYDNTYKWTIAKAVDKTEIDQSGTTATFNYTVTVSHDNGTQSNVKVTGDITVTNPNNANVLLSSVTDQLSNGVTCDVDTSSGLTVNALGTASYPYTCDLGSTVPVDPITNSVEVDWLHQILGNGTDLATGSAPFTTTAISFTGNTIDGCVSVDDPADTTSPHTFCVGDPGDPSFSFQYSHDVTGTAGTCTSFDNTATFTTDTTGTTGSDSKTVKLCVGADLTVSKTATPSFTRTYNWTIQKNVDKTRVEQVGGTATFNYSVTASETGFTDSGWQVTGTITVHNPNNWEAITLTGVSDAIDNGGICVVSGNTTQTIAAGGDSTGLTYTCTYAAKPAPLSGTNTATATWDSAAAFTPHGTASGTAPADFTNLTPSSTVNKTVTITDTFNGVLTTLGTLTATDTTPFTTHTYTYSHTVNVPANGCVNYSNTAVIVETGQHSDQTVTVCGPAKTGALTMGFWQNKNGQGIITSYCGGTSGTSLHTFLTAYAPFSDETATTCSGIATYVYNVIKAANASGSSMNAMLKAQMLATALDVYFSDPALGGNKIGAPAPIGGVTIDLTKICKMIDGSGGTATCSGSYENASAAFGGATSMTVSAMLTYAASQSNAGGTTWYGNVKATQQLAKDAFDAINNGVAFSA